MSRSFSDSKPQGARSDSLQRHNRHLSLLVANAAELLLNDDPLVFLDRLYDRLSSELGLEIYLHYQVASEDALELAAFCGLEPAAVTAIRRLSLGSEGIQCVCNTVARQRQRIVAEDIANTDDALSALVRSLGITAYVCHPLIAHGRLIGTLSFGTRRAARFDAAALELLAAATDQVAAALERARAQRELQAFARDLEARVAQRTAELERQLETQRHMQAELTRAQHQLIERREGERLALARELHDEVLQEIVALSIRLGVLQLDLTSDGAPAEIVRQRLEECRTRLAATAHSLRRVMRGLRPNALDDLGLKAALEEFVAAATELSPSPAVELWFEDDGGLPPQVALCLYRVAQEAVRNALKHARAQRIRVELYRVSEKVMMVVHDDGQGFALPAHPGQLVARGHYGLAGIEEHVRALGGALKLHSVPGEGTRLTTILDVCPDKSS